MATCQNMSENDSDSDLSDPPLSPKGVVGNSNIGLPLSSTGKRASGINDAVDRYETISAYVEQKPSSDEQLDDDEIPADAVTNKDPSVTVKSRPEFPELTSFDNFEYFLKDPEDMSYEKLYNRTAAVSMALVAYQTEFEAIDKEVTAYEILQRAQKERAEEMAKVEKAERLVGEDAQRAKVADLYRAELELEGNEWSQFVMEVEKKNPNDDTTIFHLQNLKDPIFMNQVNNRQKKLEKEKQKQRKIQKPPLINAPLPEHKPTKEEKKVESKRRLGRAIEPAVFEDKKMADVYGFEWSNKVEHVGGQPLEKVVSSRNNVNGSTGRSSRLPRQQNRKRYDDEDAGNTEVEELPAKRTAKPRIFINDDVESAPRPRAQSRDANHPVKVFPSGKRVGRPPSKSKLQNVQHALSPSLPALAPLQEAELHEAAEALVNQTVTDQATAAISIPRKKHAGGRPRKSAAEKIDKKPVVDGLVGDVLSEVPVFGAWPVEQPVFASPVKRKHAGGRPKKNHIDVQDAVEKMIADLAPLKNLNDVSIEQPVLGDVALAVPPKKKHAGGRPKKEIASLPSAGPSSVAPSFEAAAKAKPKKGAARKVENVLDFEYEPEPAISQPVTESDVDSRPTTSASASRPSTSSSGEFSTSFGNVMGTRRSTRALSKAAPNAISEVIDEPSSSASSNGNRKRSIQGTTDPSTRVMNQAPVIEYLAAPPTKRRRARAAKEEIESLEASPEPSSSQASRPKRKRTITAESSTTGVADSAVPEDSEVAPPTKKLKTADPSSSTPSTASKPRKRSKPPTPAPRAPSTRVRKPTRALLGFDGADDYEEEEELEQQFRSEYDHFQALSSPKNPVSLGKRTRKSVMDLSAAMQTEDEDEYY